MCGFGISTIFQVAIFIVVVLVVVALLKWAFGGWFTGIVGTPYWGIIQIVIGGVVAIMALLFLWKMAECAGLIGGGRLGLGSIDWA
jgi:hypothetical protein